MAVLSVVRYGDPILRRVAKPVTSVTPEVRTLTGDMIETMWKQVGIGLAAPQIGVGLRVFVMDSGKGKARVLVNPEIIDRSGVVLEEEGCLSLPGIFADVERSRWVHVAGLDGEGEPVSFEASDLQAKVVQHEMDHLNGVLFIDRLAPMARERIKKKIQKEGFGAAAHRRHAFAL